MLASTTPSLDFDTGVEFDLDPDLRSSDCLERWFWSARMVSIEPSIGGDFADLSDRIRHLDSCHGLHTYLFFALRIGTPACV